MGLVDIFTPDKTIEIKFGELCELMKEAAKNELLENAINTDVPHRYIREMLSGEVEEAKEPEADPATESEDGGATGGFDLFMRRLNEENEKEEVLSMYQMQFVEKAIQGNYKEFIENKHKHSTDSDRINEDLERIFKK